MKTVYIELLPDVPYIPLLYPNLGIQERETILFLNNAFEHLTKPLVERVSSPEAADCILLAHNVSSLKGNDAYIRTQADLARRHDKPFVVFWHGDSDAKFSHEDSVIFRISQYRSALRSNEIMMPAYADDLLEGPLSLRKKTDGKPVLGFCGWAGYKNFKNRIGTLIKNTLTKNPARIKGITYRMQAIAQLQESDFLECNFIIRSSYSGHRSTIKTDPMQARKEYIDNMLSSDYALVIKGDGNYSYRFYEALSLGRIPVLLDTECVLPLENVIEYDECVLRIPYTRIGDIDRIVAGHYASLSGDAFAEIQRKARHIFERYLRVDSFLSYAVEHFF